MVESEEFARYIETLPSDVIKNTKVITPAIAGQDYLLHVSSNPSIRKFIPRIGTRQMEEENRTVPRICTAPHLVGCMLGYNKSMSDFALKADGSEQSGGWLGGWMIYEFQFKHALRPNKQMVPDARVSDEHWLVTYSPDTVEYIPKSAGKMFLRSVNLTARSGNYPAEELNLMIEVTKPEGIYFSKSIFLKQGYHRVVGQNWWMIKDWKDVESYTITEITKEEYTTAKKLSAALLSFQEPPAFAQW